MNNPYTHSTDVHNLMAPSQVVPIILSLIKPASVLDVGCGLGTWLKVFEQLGVTDYLGVDGEYLNKNLLQIPIEKFRSQDLQEPFLLGRKYDLVISLEVAEHLEGKYADQFISTLVEHGEAILFSAAIPRQGGQNHVNEQWPAYWQEKFENHGFFCHDVIRPLIWDNKKVDWWYRQNMFLASAEYSDKRIPSLVHPECYDLNRKLLEARVNSVYSGGIGIKQSLKILLLQLRNLFK